MRDKRRRLREIAKQATENGARVLLKPYSVKLDGIEYTVCDIKHIPIRYCISNSVMIEEDLAPTYDGQPQTHSDSESEATAADTEEEAEAMQLDYIETAQQGTGNKEEQEIQQQKDGNEPVQKQDQPDKEGKKNDQTTKPIPASAAASKKPHVCLFVCLWD